MTKKKDLELAELKREKLEDESGYEVTIIEDDRENQDFEDDGYYHVLRNGVRIVFTVDPENGRVLKSTERKLSKLVDRIL